MINKPVDVVAVVAAAAVASLEIVQWSETSGFFHSPVADMIILKFNKEGIKFDARCLDLL